MTHKNKASTLATTRPAMASPFAWPALLANPPTADSRGDEKMPSIWRASTGIVAAVIADGGALMFRLGCCDAKRWVDVGCVCRCM